jgi:insulysin
MLFRKWLFLSLSLFLGVASAYETIEDKRNIPYLNPELAVRKTAKIRLKNGLEAYLISDPNVQDGGAALTVKAGSWDEPKEAEGMAHFLEHMLFLGTEKYPDEAEYDSYLSRFRGQANAFTYSDITAYLFSIKMEGFKGALDRFASFFQKPLFNPSGVNREVNAIDQEFRMNAEKDSFLRLQVLKEMASPDHPFSRFNSGNKDSLKTVSQAELIAWYDTHYSADRMRLWLFSSLPLEEMEALVEEEFGSIPDRKVESTVYPDALFLESEKGKWVKMRPIQEERMLSLVWELPESLSVAVEEKPWTLVAWVLGNEGEGSLLAQLKKEGLALGLCAGDLGLSEKKRLFFIDIPLTPKGEKEWPLVAERVFQAINRLKAEGISEPLFNSIRALQVQNFEWASPQDVFSDAMSNAFIQAYESLETYPEATAVVEKYDPAKIKAFLDLLTPKKAIFITLNPDLKDPKAYAKVAKWTATPYSVESFDLAPLENAKPHPAITVPRPNPFLPADFSLKMAHSGKTWDATVSPELIEDSAKGKIYFLADGFYEVPEAYLSFEVKTPYVTGKIPKSMALRDLWIKLYEEAIAGKLYEAKLAGVDVTIDEADEGIRVVISGFSDKLPLILEFLIDNLSLPHLNEADFDRMHADLTREYRNFKLDSPVSQAVEVFKGAVSHPYASKQARLASLKRVNYDGFTRFKDHVWDRNYTEGVLLGNLLKEEAKAYWNSWSKGLKGKGYLAKDRKEVKIEGLSQSKGPFKMVRSTEAKGNAFFLAIEEEGFSPNERNIQQLMQQALDKSYFRELRTKQQTGYLIATSAEDMKDHLFTLFVIQSANYRPEELLWRTESFLEQFVRSLPENFTEEDFTTAKEALKLQLQEKPKSIDKFGALVVKLAFDRKGDFDWMKKRIDALTPLTYKEFLQRTQEVVGRENRRRLAVFIEGKDKSGFKFHNFNKLDK